MNPERWQQIEKLVLATLERAPGERAAFLDEACFNDAALRKEIESRVEFQEKLGNFMEVPPLEMLADQLRDGPAESAREETGPDRPGSGQSTFSVEKEPAIIDGKFQLEGRLGKGGMAWVYRVRHLELGKTFALKLIQPYKSRSPEYLARFRIEAKALGRLNHPNIVQVTDFGVDSRSGPYLVMEYIEGVTLSEYIRHKGALSLDEALPILSNIARALDYAHGSGILHRDLKPANIVLVLGEAGFQDVKILDFGIARFLGPPYALETNSESDTLDKLRLPQGLWSTATAPAAGLLPGQPYSEPAYRGLTDPGTIVGTPEYIPPEVLRGETAFPAADIYSFGVLIYAVLVGQTPFQGTMSELIDLHLHKEPPLPSSVRSSLPKELDQAILRPLSKDPVSRPGRAREVMVELREAYYKAQVRQWRQSELPKRAGVATLLAALVLILYAVLEKLPAIQGLENKLFDARVRFQPLRSPDRRIMLISIDEATLSSDPRPLAEKADEFGSLLKRAFDADARFVAIDLLLPERWSNSESFSQLILDHSKNMVLASYSSADEGVKGPECVRGLVTVALGREKVEKLFGFVNLQEDPDGVVRTMPLIFQDQQGKSVYSFSARAAGILTARSPVEAFSETRLSVDYSIDWTKFHRISWKNLADTLAKEPGVFRDRLILVGGEFAGSGDVYRTAPYSSTLPREVSGLVLQALTLNTLLEGRQMKRMGRTLVVVFLCITVAIGSMAILFLPRTGWAIGTLAASCLFYILASFLFFRWNQWLWPIAAPAVTFCLATVSAILLRRQLPSFPKISNEEGI